MCGDSCAIDICQNIIQRNQFFLIAPTHSYAHSHARTLTQRPYLNLSAHTRWHTLNNDSQLLPDTIKRCETQAGLPSESNNVSHSFLIFHANPFFQTNTGEQQIV